MGWSAGIFGFLLAVAYCPFIGGAAVTPRILLLSAVVPAALLGLALAGRRMVITWPHVFGGLFMGWAALSMAWSTTPYDSVDVLFQMGLLAGCFMLGSHLGTLRPLLVGLALGLGVSSALVLVELLSGWHIEQLSGAGIITNYGALFVNRNYLGEVAALVFVGFLAVDRRLIPGVLPTVPVWVAACLLPALLVAKSRNSALAIAVVYLVMLWEVGYQRLVLVAICVGFWAFVGALFVVNTGSLVDRLHIWGDGVRALSLFGTGLGSFVTAPAYFSDAMGQRNVYAHNEFLQVAVELGLPGLALFLAFCWSVLSRRVGDGPGRYVFLAALVEACLGFPFHLPVSGALALYMAGSVCRILPWDGVEA